MSAPSSHARGWQPDCGDSAIMSHGRVLLVLAGLVLSACTAGRQAAGSLPASGSMSVSPSDDCQPAPGWVAARIEATLAVRGATLTRLFIGRATNLSGGPGEVRSDIFRSAWWVAGLIGVGARPEVGVWLVSGLKEGDPNLRVLPADEVALRYSALVPRAEPFKGDGLEAVRSCVGPPPEP